MSQWTPCQNISDQVPATYCSPAMRQMLQDLIDGRPVVTRSIFGAAVFQSLRSRGWLDVDGKPTDAGRDALSRL